MRFVVLPHSRDRVLTTDGVVATGRTTAAHAGRTIVVTHAPDEVYCSTTRSPGLEPRSA